MTDSEMREFLTRWLLEFGTRVVGAERWGCGWYDEILRKHRTFSVNEGQGINFFTRVRVLYDDEPAVSGYQLNQAGLDFIKGEQRDPNGCSETIPPDAGAV